VRRWLAALTVCVTGSAALTGFLCWRAVDSATTGHPHAVTVVASTDVWGSVARAVAGGHLPVRSILTGADTDPHSYAPSPAEAAAITDATVVVYNGGGYDPWVDQVLATHPSVQSVDAYSLLGAAGSDANEHVFYDLRVAKAVATSLANQLATIDPANAADYQANAAAFGRGADAVAGSERAIATAYPETGVVVTEPVGYYLLEASGLVDRTPPAFSSANENETDPSASDMATVLDLVKHRQVSAVLVNPQTATPAIEGLQAAARRAGVPVTEVTETLPTGSDYLTWQRDTVNQLLAALRSSQSSSR
jgi:zinc/manganese transport system substrate-binding protein